MNVKRVSDEDLLKAYEETGSVWKAGDRLDLCGQSVHERLVKLNKNRNANVFSDDEKELLRCEYKAHADSGRLKELADRMGRTVPFLCRKAKELGLTDGSRHGGANGRTAYRRGRDFEYSTKKRLEKAGFVVLRSPASKGLADLWAVKDGKIWFVQCKLHGAISPAECDALYDFAHEAGATPVIAQRPTGKTRGFEFFEVTGHRGPLRGKHPRPWTQINPGTMGETA